MKKILIILLICMISFSFGWYIHKPKDTIMPLDVQKAFDSGGLERLQ